MTTRDSVLAALKAAGDAGVSGESLAGELGVSRVAVAKHVKVLRSAGYGIVAELGVGYRLVSVPDAPLPAEVAPALESVLWVRLEGGGETASTNDDARALARHGAPEGTVVLASRQTAGRGRLGRTWASPGGGAYLSVVLRPPVAPAEVAPLSLVVGTGVARGLARLGADVQLKWPNDVQLSGRKLAGVLLEMAAEADRVDWVVAGVGLNVHPPVGAESAASAHGVAYLSDVVPGIRIAEATAAVLDGIGGAYAEWLAAGFAPMRAEYDSRSSLGGRHVVVSDMSGLARAEGEVVGVDDGGRLLVAGGSGVQAVAAGEVTLRGTAS